MIILIDWKPERAIYAKVKDHDKVTASVRHNPLGASNYKKTSGSKHLRLKESECGNSKLLGRITVIAFNVPFPYIYHFPNFSKIRGVTPLAGHHSINQIWARAHLFGTLIYSIYKISFIFDGNAWSENFQNTKHFFLHLLKSVSNKHTLFELLSSWSVHQHPPREQLHSGRETWLSIVERTSALSKMMSRYKNTKNIQKRELAKLIIWKGGLGNRERPGGLKTRKGGPGKN